MKKILIASVAGAAMSMFIGGAQAADMDYERALALAVSGKVESWVGFTSITNAEDDAEFGDDGYGVSGGSAALSLPLGDKLSVQMDASWERNLDSLGGTVDNNVFSHSHQFAGHLSWRDPGSYLFGLFGGAGSAQTDSGNSDGTYRFAGGEAQIYLNDLTFYVQGGAIWSISDDDHLGALESVTDSECCGNGHAFFVRGVGRWFIDPVSRLQFEGSFANGDVDVEVDTGNMDIFEWGVRYDRVFALPVVGDSQLFAAYRGSSFDKQGNDPGSFVEHTFMVGTSIHFGGNSMQEFDRVGATLDTPNIGRWVISGAQVE